VADISEIVWYNVSMTKESEKKLLELKKQALALMEQSGFAITKDVDVQLDEKLPFMGYTTERDGKTIVVVAGRAMEGGMAINLLIHELSHVYRGQSGHPSHDYGLLTAIAAWVMHGKVVHDYQEKTIHTIINHLQDLYADDISFAVFKKTASNQNLNEFFLGWIHEPSTAKNPEVRAWENAENLLSAAFAQSNLERHHVVDTDGKVAKAVAEFLAKLDKHMAEKYEFFRVFMVHMPEKVTEKEFESHLIKYLGEFLKLTKLQ
jgi:hypothetical protein